MAAQKTWFVYLIECVDGSLYTGITVDLESRFKAHREGRGARYMRLHPPLRMLAAEAHPDRSSAARRPSTASSNWRPRRSGPTPKP
jgi:predicted GIY-YIG superfamily endonuclease